jgi:hypothetical protein
MDVPSKPLYDRGEPVAWHASSRHGAGTGIITEVRITGAGITYEVHKLVDGKATGQTLTLPEDIVYPTRGVHDPRPHPAPLRGPSA